MPCPDLTVIIPTLNEAETLPGLLADLARQERIGLEVLVVDGGSKDGTARDALFQLKRLDLSGAVVSSPPGRGRQLNLGASMAQSDWLLLLHADSRLQDDTQLRDALDRLRSETPDCLAGRFRLGFDLHGDELSPGFVYYEMKACLDRPGCIHGDQGFLLARQTFQVHGPFREDLPVMEDTYFADQLRSHGRWVLLDSTLKTSARRFQTEGLKTRQTLNALLMNFLATGWDDFLRSAPNIYRQQAVAGPLRLKPFLTEIRRQLNSLPLRRRAQLWLATGRYVRANAWQIVLHRALQDAYRTGRRPALPLLTVKLERFDRWFDRLTDHLPGHAVTAALVWVWFQLRSFSAESDQHPA